MKYLYQAIPGGSVEKFSDALCKTKFGTIKPRWAWSDLYRKEVRKNITAPYGSAASRDDQRSMDYLRWQRENKAIA